MCNLGWLKILTNLERFLWQRTWRPCGWNKQGKLITSCPLFVPPLFKIKYTWHHLSYSTRFYLKVDLYATFGSISCDLIRTGQINWTPRFVSTTSLFCISREEEEEKKKNEKNCRRSRFLLKFRLNQAYKSELSVQLNWPLKPVSTSVKYKCIFGQRYKNRMNNNPKNMKQKLTLHDDMIEGDHACERH